MRHFGRIGCLPFLLAVILGCSTQAFAAQSFTAKFPLVFEPNRGQAPADIRYLLRKGALDGEFQKDGIRLRLLGRTKAVSQVKMRLVGARDDAAITGGGAIQGYTNYLLGSDPGHWLRGLPNYTEVRYSRIYPGTDLVFYGNDGLLEHDFEVQPGADPNRIAFRLDGAENLTLDENGDLRIGLVDGVITFERPAAYQIVAGVRRNVNAAFSVDKDGTVRFRLGSYDRARELVIDPALSFSTYLDTLSDTVSAVATDATGNTYITGLTFNSTFPATAGVFQPTCESCANSAQAVFVTKLNAAGTAQVYSTFLGGSESNQPTGLAVDSNGDAIITGYTASTDFPLKNPINAGTPSSMDGFVTSLAPDGSSLNFSSRLGGTSSQGTSASTFPGGVAVDALGNVYVSGMTESSYLPVTSGALDAGVPSYFNGFFVFLTKFQPSGTLVYSALLGNVGEASDCCTVVGVAVDSAQNAYVAGTVGVEDFSSTTPWPVTAGAYQSTMIAPGDTAPFAAKVSADGSTLLYSTLVTTGEASGMALKSDNQLILVGTPNYNYPVTSNAFSSAVNSSFVATLSADGSQLLYSSYFGGSENSGTTTDAVTQDAQGNIWLAGYTRDSTFPLVTPLSAQIPSSSIGEAVTSFLSEFDSSGTELKFSTFMGDLSGSGLKIALDSAGKVHAAGTTSAPIYTTTGAFIGAVTSAPPGYTYTYPYAALIDPTATSGTLCLGESASYGLSFGYLPPQGTASQSVQVTNCGSAPLTIGSIASSNAVFTVPAATNGCTGSLAVGAACTVSVEFAPPAAQAYSGQLTFTSNASIATTSIPLNGSGGEPAAGFGPTGITQRLNFSPELVGQTSASEFIALYNNGTVPLTIYLSQITVTSGFVLAPGGTCTSSLPARQYCLIFVEFAPTTAGTFNGTLSVSSNDPVNPTISASLTGTAYASYPIPTITALFSPSYPIGGTSPISMSVEGGNFFPASVVYINGAAQATTYEGGGGLSVTFPSSLLNAVGQFPVTVVNPSPGGGSSAPYPLIGYLSIPLTASALTVDPVGGLLYAAIPASATQNPNTVIPINPTTGVAMTPVAVASGPRALAVSADGTELYVASAGVLQRINLQTLALERTFNLPVDPEWGQTYVQEMHVVPGSPQSIVVELFANVDPAEDGAALYNDSGLVNWLPGEAPTRSPLQMDSFAFTSPTSIYALPAGAFFTNVQVSPTGLSYSGGGGGAGGITEQTGSIIRSDGTLLYTNSGEVWNPSTQSLLGTYLEASGNQLFYTPSVVPDSANGQTDFLDEDAEYSQSQALTIDVYAQAGFGLLGTVPFTSIYPPDATDLVRWGSNGFAFRCVDITGSTTSANQIVIVTSNLVSQNSETPIPIVSSVSPATVYSGGPAFTLRVTGSGFTSASTVLINGNSRTTTYVSGTSLTAQVLATDIVQNGQLSVQVTTPAPGGGTSNEMVVSIQAPPLTTPTVTVTPSATSITTAQALTVAVVVSGASGNPTPTGSVVLSGGGYTSTATILSGGSASINIPAGLLGPGSDTLTVSYSPDANSSSTYNSASGSNTVTVSKITPTVTVTPSSTSITTAQALTVTVAVTGGTGIPTPTGSVIMTGGGFTSATTTLNAGSAQINIPAGSLTTGNDTLSVSYTPDANGSSTYNSASGSNSVTVTASNKTTPTVTVTPSSSSITTTQLLSVTITVSGTPTPTGAVTLSSGTYSSAATTLISGSATINISAGSLIAGTDTLTATYAPGTSSSATYNSASGTGSVMVTKATPTVSVMPSSNSINSAQALSVTVTAAGTPSPTGTVTLSSGSYASTAATLTNGSATINVPPDSLSAGTNTLTAAYSGDKIYNIATGTASVTVSPPPSFTLSASPATLSVAQGGSGTSTITVTDVGGFSGNITFAGSGLPSGVTTSFAAGSVPGTEILTLAVSTSAEVTSTPVAVTVTGTSGTLGATTGVSLSITPLPSFSVGSGGTTSMSVSPGATTGNTGTISIEGTNGFAGTVNLSCNVTTSLTNASDIPACSLNPVSVTISGTAVQTSVLTVTTTAASSADNNIKKLVWPTGGTTIALLVLLVVPRRRRNWLAMMGIFILYVVIGAVGCGGGSGGGGGGGGGGNSGTTAGTYTITVTGTSGAVSATVGTVTLTVQ